jgi:NADPH-dependent 2,4-dienoyl-CoA reductase/sulfur reductase-like enzyme
VEVYTKHVVEEIDRKNKEIRVVNLNGGQVSFHRYDKLIIAAGSKHKSVKALSMPAENLFGLNDIHDLIKLSNYIKANNSKSAAIIGSGYIGLEAADALHKSGFSVTVIEKNDNPMHHAEVEVQHLIKELLSRNGIRFFGGIRNLKANYSGNRIESLIVEGRILEFDLILIAAGFKPNSSLAEKAKLTLGDYGGIKTDERLKTSDPHIYAAGDCLEIINEVTGRPYYLPIATIARDYGHIAGENAAGGNVRTTPVVKNISVKVLDKFFITVGLSSAEAEKYGFKFNTVSETANNLVKVIPGSDKVFGKIIYEKETKRILGASFIGGKEVSGYGDLVSALIRTMQPAGVLASVNYNYTPPLSPYINLLSLLGRKIK